MTATRSGRAVAAATAVLALPFALIGCSDPFPGREEVTGAVTLRGRPMDHGYIMFVPADPGSPTRGGAGVVNGVYRMPKAQGLAPGRYKVSISSPDGKTPDPRSGAAPGPTGNFASRERVPAAFNARSTLQVEVKEGRPNAFDFAVP